MGSEPPRLEEVFVCRRCGDCCRGLGGTLVGEADIAAIAGYLGIDADRLRAEYCTRSGSRWMLGQKADGYCVFWDRLCTIHPVKPRMCRQWPLLESVLVDAVNWRSMASMCPGIRPDADLGRVRVLIEDYLARCPENARRRRPHERREPERRNTP